MKNPYKLAFMALAVMAFGCSSDSDGDGGGGSGNCNSDITFLQTGKFQKFKISQFGFDAGTMKLTFGDCNGSNGFAMNMETRNTANTVVSDIDGWAWQDGVFMTTDATGDGAPFTKIYKKDAQLNDTWTEDYNGATIVHTVVDMDSLITVPAGSFHCKVYHYEKSDIINDSYIFWHDDIGQVMEDAGFVKYELMEHN